MMEDLPGFYLLTFMKPDRVGNRPVYDYFYRILLLNKVWVLGNSFRFSKRILLYDFLLIFFELIVVMGNELMKYSNGGRK